LEESMAKKKVEATDEVAMICTCDRIPLPSGEVVVRDVEFLASAADARAYEASERAQRV
jgi:hypothetical protein